jgi:hypothetical protein
VTSTRFLPILGITLLSLAAIPLAILTISLIAGRTDACLISIHDDRNNFFCDLGVRLRFTP